MNQENCCPSYSWGRRRDQNCHRHRCLLCSLHCSTFRNFCRPRSTYLLFSSSGWKSCLGLHSHPLSLQWCQDWTSSQSLLPLLDVDYRRGVLSLISLQHLCPHWWSNQLLYWLWWFTCSYINLSPLLQFDVTALARFTLLITSFSSSTLVNSLLSFVRSHPLTTSLAGTSLSSKMSSFKVPLGRRLCDCSEYHDRSESCTYFHTLYWASSPCKHLYCSCLPHCI